MNTTIIKIRRGINGYRYSACNHNGYFIGNANRISEIRKRWAWEIRHGLVVLVRELKEEPQGGKGASEKIDKGEQSCRKTIRMNQKEYSG